MARRKASALANAGNTDQLENRRPGDATPPSSRADYVHAVVRQEILDGTLEPGQAILQDKLASRLGVSITPVREALRRLESAGLVSYQAHYGATVTQLSADAVRELYQLRASVEGLGARLAAGRITPAHLLDLRELHTDMQQAHAAGDMDRLTQGSRRFHASIAEIGGPALLARHLRWIWDSYPVPVAASAWQIGDLATGALTAHADLLDALERQDGALAEQLMHDHIAGAGTARLGGRAHPDAPPGASRGDGSEQPAR